MLLLLTALACLSTALALSERATLLRLYSDANGSRWKKDTGWREAHDEDDPIPICSWHGVTCMDGLVLDDQGVVGLDLSENHLSGQVPKALWSMPHLFTVKFQGNNIKDGGFDGFPSEAPVNVINLSENRLTHVTGISSAPKSLTELRLDSNSFDGKFPSELLKLDRLKNLDLSYNPGMSGNVPSGIGEMISLRELELSHTSLHGNIPSEFGLLKDLRYLGMDETHIHGPIPAELNNMQHIKYLSIESWESDSGNLSGPLPSFTSLMYLKELYLNGNRLTGTVPADFLSNVVEKKELLAIGLSDNNIDGKLPSELSRFKRLNIDVEGNMIWGIPPELCEMKLWNEGSVGSFGCDGIACPTGTFSEKGRRETSEDECVECPRYGNAKYVGMSQCEVERDELGIPVEGHTEAQPPSSDVETDEFGIPVEGHTKAQPSTSGIETDEFGILVEGHTAQPSASRSEAVSLGGGGGGLSGFTKLVVVLVGVAVPIFILLALWKGYVRRTTGIEKDPDGASSSEMSCTDTSLAKKTFESGMTNDEEIANEGILL